MRSMMKKRCNKMWRVLYEKEKNACYIEKKISVVNFCDDFQIEFEENF
jgi:hypothetical protein